MSWTILDLSCNRYQHIQARRRNVVSPGPHCVRGMHRKGTMLPNSLCFDVSPHNAGRGGLNAHLWDEDQGLPSRTSEASRPWRTSDASRPPLQSAYPLLGERGPAETPALGDVRWLDTSRGSRLANAAPVNPVWRWRKKRPSLEPFLITLGPW